MKYSLTSFALSSLLFVSATITLAAVEVGDKIAKITTKDGQTYNQVVVRKIHPDGISIIHESGVATIKAGDLSDGTLLKRGSPTNKPRELPHAKQEDPTTDQDVGKQPDLKTTTGKLYKSFKVTKLEPDGIRIQHADGIVKVLFTELSLEMQQHYGYDAGKAAEYNKNQQEAAKLNAAWSIIPAGAFRMGAVYQPPEEWAAERPLHQVQVSAFYMAKYEVTKALWDKIWTWAAANGYTDLHEGWGHAPGQPVYKINWYDAVKWCNARSEMENLTPCYTLLGTAYRTTESNLVVCNWKANGYRLPTEAEWEKAARGGLIGYDYPCGNSITHRDANYDNKTDEQKLGIELLQVRYKNGVAIDKVAVPHTSPAGSFSPNGYGLYDMAGNVFEWCWDWYSSTYYASSPRTDPRGADSGVKRVVRGGCWDYSVANCRNATRNELDPTWANNSTGFRLARTLVP